jgi:predicted nucleic acid-binding Zn ribbon protein
VGDIVSELLARRGYAQSQAAEDCLAAWQAVAGTWSRHTCPGKLRRGVLHVHVENSAVLQELTFRKHDLLRQLREELPHHRLVDLRFRLAALDEPCA